MAGGGLRADGRAARAGPVLWSEWAEALSAEVKQPDAAADGSDYYEHWLAALEKLLAAKGVAATAEVDARRRRLGARRPRNAARQADPAGERSAERRLTAAAFRDTCLAVVRTPGIEPG